MKSSFEQFLRRFRALPCRGFRPLVVGALGGFFVLATTLPAASSPPPMWAEPQETAEEASARAQDPPPRGASGLAFDHHRHDFEATIGSHHLYHSFFFENQGQLPVVLKNIEISCSCTVSGIAVDGREFQVGEVIPPGAKGQIRFRVLTDGVDGLKPVSVFVITDKGRDQLLMVMNSVPEFDVQPNLGVIDQLGPGREGEVSYVVRSNRDMPFQVVDWGLPMPPAPAPAMAEGQDLREYEKQIEEHDQRMSLRLRGKPAQLKVRFEKLEAAAWRVVLSFRAGDQTGDRSHRIRFVTDLDTAFLVTLAVNEAPPVFLEPGPSVFLGEVPFGQSREWRFDLIDLDPTHELKVSRGKVRAQLKGHFEVRFEEPKGVQDSVRAIFVRALPGLPLGTFTGILVIETDHPKYPRVRVEFDGIVHDEKD